MSKIRFALLGAGHIGKRHAEVIIRNAESELVAIIDIDNSKKIIADNYDIPFFDSLESFFDSKIEVDVINIATPNFLHSPQAKLVLENNIHVLIEKPMTLNAHEAEELIEIADERKLKIFTVMQNRYSPPAHWLKNIVSNDILGKVYMVQMNCLWNRDERYYTKDSWHGKLASDGGVLFTQFSHFIDTLYWLLGDLEVVNAKLFNFNHQHTTEFDDSGIALLQSNNVTQVNINFSTALFDQNMESSVTIIAEKGSVKVGGQYMNRVEYCHIKDYQLPHLEATQPSNNYGSYQGSAQNHDFVIQNVNDVLLRGAEIMTNGADGLAVVRIIQDIYKKSS
jgi:UDP-N-acetyl-2-amino-2-deoxyglucuronate dehydrogenase